MFEFVGVCWFGMFWCVLFFGFAVYGFGFFDLLWWIVLFVFWVGGLFLVWDVFDI